MIRKHIIVFFVLVAVLITFSCEEMGLNLTDLSRWNTDEYMKKATPKSIRLYVKAGADPKEKDEKGNTPLYLAAQWNPNPEVIKELIKSGANVQENNSRILYVASYFNNGKVVQALIDAGADVNAKQTEKYFNTVLHTATLYENIEIMQILIKAGADVNVQDDMGSTPLHVVAMVHGSPDIMQVLIEAGADVTIKNDYNSTPCDYLPSNHENILICKEA